MYPLLFLALMHACNSYTRFLLFDPGATYAHPRVPLTTPLHVWLHCMVLPRTCPPPSKYTSYHLSNNPHKSYRILLKRCRIVGTSSATRSAGQTMKRWPVWPSARTTPPPPTVRGPRGTARPGTESVLAGCATRPRSAGSGLKEGSSSKEVTGMGRLGLGNSKVTGMGRLDPNRGGMDPSRPGIGKTKSWECVCTCWPKVLCIYTSMRTNRNMRINGHEWCIFVILCFVLKFEGCVLVVSNVCNIWG